MRIAEQALIDTNILVFALDEDSPLHQKAVDVQQDVADGKIPGCLTPQNLLELFAIITDSRRVPKPVVPERALDLIEQYVQASEYKKVYPLRETTFHRLVQLVRRTPIKRGDIFDACLVAVMLENQVTTILTDNEKDFQRFAGIRAINPFK